MSEDEVARLTKLVHQHSRRADMANERAERWKKRRDAEFERAEQAEAEVRRVTKQRP